MSAADRLTDERAAVLEIAALGRRAQNDPGHYVARIMDDPRDNGDVERLDRWQARALDAAVDGYLAARPAPDTLAAHVQADVWVATSDGTIECVADSREAATEALDARLALIGADPGDDGWYQPQLQEYQDGTWWKRWYHNPHIVVGSQTRSQEVRRMPLLRALLAGRPDASPEGGGE